MPALNFKAQFVPKIQDGTKRHTIRATRKVPVKRGDALYLYCGMRHKGAFRILPDAVKCTETQTIQIQSLVGGVRIVIDGNELAEDEMQRLAQADGFENLAAFYHFWQTTHGDAQGHVNFAGQIIHWRQEGCWLTAGWHRAQGISGGESMSKQDSENRVGNWIQTYTGQKFWPIDPREGEIVIEDIAHSLSLQCRFNGHINNFYSVAQHCLHVSQLSNSENALWGLLHDASEAYLCDLPSPLKHFSTMGTEYRKIESKLMVFICLRFGLSITEPEDVRSADQMMLYWERRDLLPPPMIPWEKEAPPLPETVLSPMQPETAEKAFLLRFRELINV